MDRESLKSAGWTAHEVDGFTGVVGPFWTRGSGAESEIGLIAEQRHCNNHLGIVHGGVLMTFADLGLGLGVARALGGSHCATAQLQVQFVAAASIGAFITCRPELVRRSRHLVFVRGLIGADGRIVASADGIWKVLERKQP